MSQGRGTREFQRALRALLIWSFWGFPGLLQGGTEGNQVATEGCDADYGYDHAPSHEKEPSGIEQIRITCEHRSSSGRGARSLERFASGSLWCWLTIKSSFWPHGNRVLMLARGGPSGPDPRGQELDLVAELFGRRRRRLILHVLLHPRFAIGFEFLYFRLLIGSQQLVHLVVDACLLDGYLDIEFRLLSG